MSFAETQKALLTLLLLGINLDIDTFMFVVL